MLAAIRLIADAAGMLELARLISLHDARLYAFTLYFTSTVSDASCRHRSDDYTLSFAYAIDSALMKRQISRRFLLASYIDGFSSLLLLLLLRRYTHFAKHTEAGGLAECTSRMAAGRRDLHINSFLAI